jgi:hypothetical protein
MTTTKAINVKPFIAGARGLGVLAVVLACAAAAVAAWAAEPKSDHPLVGTWKLVSAKYGGEESKLPEGATTLKHVTPSQFMWASYDKDGLVTRAAGGFYTVKGDDYQETPEYGLSSDFDLIKGKAQSFKWKVEGNKWYHTGKLSSGLTIDEVWQRIDRK